VVTVTDPVGLTEQAPSGASPVWSPDGRSVSYVEYRHPPGDAFSNSDVVAQYDAQSQARTDLFTAASLGFGDNLSLGDLRWAPDGSRLALSAYVQNTGTRLVSVAVGVHRVQTVAGVPPDDSMYSLGYSADSQYLAYVEFAQPGFAPQLMVRGPDNTVRAQFAFSGAAWSPSGHQLAVANQAGVLVTDPATGNLALITTKNCYQVNWYDLNETGK
jgi:Tol biopolymer transport system component